MRQCTKCGEIKDDSAFYADKRRKNGLKAICKKCDAAQLKKYRNDNREKVKLAERVRYRENPEKYRSRSIKWHRINPTKYKESWDKWREKNPEKVLYYNAKTFLSRNGLHEKENREAFNMLIGLKIVQLKSLRYIKENGNGKEERVDN